MCQSFSDGKMERWGNIYKQMVYRASGLKSQQICQSYQRDLSSSTHTSQTHFHEYIYTKCSSSPKVSLRPSSSSSQSSPVLKVPLPAAAVEGFKAKYVPHSLYLFPFIATFPTQSFNPKFKPPFNTASSVTPSAVKGISAPAEPCAKTTRDQPIQIQAIERISMEETVRRCPLAIIRMELGKRRRFVVRIPGVGISRDGENRFCLTREAGGNQGWKDTRREIGSKRGVSKGDQMSLRYVDRHVIGQVAGAGINLGGKQGGGGAGFCFLLGNSKRSITGGQKRAIIEFHIYPAIYMKLCSILAHTRVDALAF